MLGLNLTCTKEQAGYSAKVAGTLEPDDREHCKGFGVSPVAFVQKQVKRVKRSNFKHLRGFLILWILLFVYFKDTMKMRFFRKSILWKWKLLGIYLKIIIDSIFLQIFLHQNLGRFWLEVLCLWRITELFLRCYKRHREKVNHRKTTQLNLYVKDNF